MTPANSTRSRAISYPPKTVKRAARAIGCAPFQLPFYTAMYNQSVALGAIAGHTGVQYQYTRQPITELAAESDLLWLIQVGVLRREVDGQGLTDSFRLTPLGRQLTEEWQNQGRTWQTVSWLDHLLNTLNRWLRLSV